MTTLVLIHMNGLGKVSIIVSNFNVQCCFTLLWSIKIVLIDVDNFYSYIFMYTIILVQVIAFIMCLFERDCSLSNNSIRLGKSFASCMYIVNLRIGWMCFSTHSIRSLASVGACATSKFIADSLWRVVGRRKHETSSHNDEKYENNYFQFITSASF